MAVLKVLTGTHAGAEVELFEGTCLLGSGTECDIVLSDRMLAEEHIRFHVSQETVEVENLAPDSVLSVNGKPMTEARFVLDPFAPVGIGTLFLAVGPSDAQWPQIDLAAFFERGEDTTSPENNDEQGEKTAGAGPQKKSAATMHLPLAQGHERKIKKKLFSGKVFATLLVVTILAVFYVQLEPHFAKTGKKMRSSGTSEIQIVKNLLATMRLNLEIKESASGKLSISGIVKTKKQKTELVEALKKKRVRANSSAVTSGEALVSSADAVLKGLLGNDALVSVYQGTQLGTIVIKGYIPERQKVDSVLQQIEADIPGVLKVEEKIETLNDRVAELRGLLEKHRLLEVLTIGYENGVLILRGSLPDEHQNTWKAVEREFKRRYGNIPEIRYVGLLNPTETPLETELNILGVSLGKIPFVIFSGGGRYPVGSRLENGYIIEEITDTHLRLRSGEDHYLFYLEESLYGQ